jgi:tRNA-specific 2-thiouridylase
VVTALSLFSGSLASQVATRLIEQSPRVDKVFLLYFRSPFFEEYDRVREIVKQGWPRSSFRTQSLKKDYRRLANIPIGDCFSLTRSCLSCRTLFLSRAIRYMERIQADFIVTGERVGRHGLFEEEMKRITEDLGIGGLVLRPLSAQLLPPTRAEVEGWVDRDCLGDLIADENDRLTQLAQDLGLRSDYCLDSALRCKLTRPGFGERLQNLFEEEGFTLNALKLLDFTLYYKHPPDVKIALAMDEEEKRLLQSFFLPQDLRVYLPTHRGPMTLVRTKWQDKNAVEIQGIIELAGRITATHSEAAPLSTVQVSYRFENDDETLRLMVRPFSSVDEITAHCFVSRSPSPLSSRATSSP